MSVVLLNERSERREEVGAYKSEIVTLTPEKAKEWLESYAFKGQRALRPRHIEYLMTEIEHDRLDADQIVLCELNGHSYLTDGQHRLAALAASTKPCSFNVLRRKVRDMDEVQADYRRRDRGLARNISDCLKACGPARDLGLSQQQLSGFSGAFTILANGFASRNAEWEPSARSVDVRLEFIEDWGPVALCYFESLKGATTKDARRFFRSPVVALGLVTFKYQEKVAREFWHTSVMDDGLRKGQPEKAIFNFLKDNPTMAYPPQIYCRYLASGWNARWDKREIATLRAQASYNPITIKGTPYNGDDVIELEYE